jgi:hypothetical protein
VGIVEGCSTITISGVFTGGTPTTAPIYSLQLSDDLTNWITTSCTLSPTAAGAFKSVSMGTPAKYARLIVSTASSGGTAYGLTYMMIQGWQEPPSTVSIGSGTSNIGSVTLPSSSTPTLSTFTSTTSATVLTASGSTKAVTLFNGSSATAYILLGSGTASSSNYSFYLVQGDLVTLNNYTGTITGLLSATGSVSVTQLT